MLLKFKILITYNCNGLDARWILATRKNYCAKAFARAKLSAFRLALCRWLARSRLLLVHALFVAPRIREGARHKQIWPLLPKFNSHIVMALLSYHRLCNGKRALLHAVFDIASTTCTRQCGRSFLDEAEARRSRVAASRDESDMHGAPDVKLF